MHAQMRRCRTFGLCLAVSLALAAPAARADQQKMSDSQRLDQLEKENADLRRRLELLEGSSTQDVYVAKASIPEKTLEFLGQTELSGFVSSSFFHNFNNSSDGLIPGRGFDYRSDQFMINKFVITLEKPVDYNAFDWTAGYSVQTIFGQDAEFTQQDDFNLGTDGDLFLANVVVNVPVGNGLKITIGKYGTPLGYELTLTEQNANWSGGNQWTFVEPFTHTGVVLGYKPTSELEVQLLLNNGWDDVNDNNNAKSLMGYINYAPNDNTSFTLIGYGGPEQDDNSSNWRDGVELVATRVLTPQLSSAVQIDYGHEQNAAVHLDPATGDPFISGDAQWWAAGLWLTYDFTEKVQAALRGDYLNDINGARTSDSPSRNPLPANSGQELYSVTLTLNYKPLKEVRISPEFRWDHSTLDNAFNGYADQITLGFGVAYFY